MEPLTTEVSPSSIELGDEEQAETFIGENAPADPEKARRLNKKPILLANLKTSKDLPNMALAYSIHKSMALLSITKISVQLLLSIKSFALTPSFSVGFIR